MLDLVPEDPLLAAAERLYALTPGEFTAARTGLAKEAKGDGDKELAARIGRLRKPSLAAWVVNQLVRQRADDMRQLLDVGEALRSAQADLDAAALRELGRQRRRLTAAVARQGRSLAADQGQRVSEQVTNQVEDTLHAAMIDPKAADAVRSGMLTEALTATGVESLDAGSVVADPAAIGSEPAATQVAAPALTVVPDNTKALEAARKAVEEAVEEAVRARRKRDKAVERVATREARVLEIQSRLEEVRRQLAELEHALERASDDLEDSEAKRDKAERRAQEATSAESEARAGLKAVEH
jgi:hypothetical protein